MTSSVRSSDSSPLARLMGDGKSRVALGAALVVALWVRLPGLTSKDLWFDDAWAALPARQPLHTAVHMVVTTPGYTLANRLWIRLNPDVTWWAQLPTLLFGLLAVVAIYALLQYFNTSRLVQYLGTAIVVLSPTTVTYSTRVKEYAFDFLLGVALVALGERVRRAPSSKHLGQLGLFSTVSVFISLSAAVAVAGVWLAVVLVAFWQPPLRRRILGWCTATLVVSCALALPFALAVPSVLNRNWRRRGFLFDPSNFHTARHTAIAIYSGLAHGLFAVPIQFSSSSWKMWSAVVAVIVASSVAAMLIIALRRTILSRPNFSRTTPAALMVFLAIVAAFSSRVPLGDGRTDEVLFPALLVLLGLTVGPVLDKVIGWLRHRSAVVARLVVIIMIGGGLFFGHLHHARYPTIDLRGLSAKLATTTEGTSRLVTVVDGFNAFGWGYYNLTPSKVAFGPDHGHIWPQGFHVVSTVDATVISNNDMKIPGRFRDLKQRADAVWYVGFENGTYNPYAPLPYGLRFSATYTELLREGWKPRPGYAVLAEHCYAMLLTR